MNKKENIKQIRIYHGPVNIVGIGGYCAEYQRRKGLSSDFIVWYDDTVRQNHHVNLQIDKVNRFKKIWRIFINFLKCYKKYDIFHFYFGLSLLPFGLDLPILKMLDKKIIMNYCGSDIRLEEVEKKRNPYWKYIPETGRLIKDKGMDKFKKLMMWWHDKWVDKVIAGKNIYYSAITTIRREKIIDRLYINNAIPVNYEKPIFKTNNPPVIVHAPSNPELKGTKYIEKTLENLKNKGYKFKYIKLYNRPNTEVHKILKNEADIVIDQLLLGGFGTFTVEAMYYGKPVCVYIIDEVREKYFPKIPVVNCTIDNIEEKLKFLIENPAERVKIGKKAYIFARKYFDYITENEKLIRIYEELVNINGDTV